MKKTFHIGDVLSITTGKLVSLRGMEGIYDILNHMTGGSLFTHQLGRAAQECRPWLLRWFPQLATVSTDELKAKLDGARNSDSNRIVGAWVEEQATRFGRTFEVDQIPADDHEKKHPYDELVEMLGSDERIVVVDAAGDEGK